MLNVQDLVDAKVYESEEAAIEDAVRHLLRSRPDLRVRVAIHQYVNEGISLGAAADLAGISWAQMKEILVEGGIQPQLGPETVTEASQEADVLREFFSRASKSK